MLTGSINKQAETDPLIEGGSYEYIHADGRIETGTVMGTVWDPVLKTKRGWLYSHGRGHIPMEVVEGTESFTDWRLYAAPSKGAASNAAGKHKSKR